MITRMHFKSLAVFVAVAFFSAGCGSTCLETTDDTPKNIILFIGDGMGLPQVTAAKAIKGKLNMERCALAGVVTTHSASHFTTDSAAAATAMATGYKTTNYMLSVSKDGSRLKTALEYAEENSKATGLVATSTITHATPAAFAAHNKSRKKENEIAEHMVSSGVDVLFGGGWRNFAPSSKVGSKRKDEKDLIAELKKRMPVITTPDEFAKLGDVKAAAGLFKAAALPLAKDRLPSLKAMTTKAIEILSKNEEGFFLMVEGSQIDWEGHGNRANTLIAEVVDFDDAVGAGMDFAELNGDTLVIVVADHETGGFALQGGSLEKKQVSKVKFTTGSHTASMVPLFAYGPGSSVFGGIIDNTDIGKTLIKYLRKKNR